MAASDCDSTPDVGKKKPSKAARIAGVISTSLWLTGFALLFILKPGDRFVWTSDALLLIGFWPLLIVWRPGWTWIIFGVTNIFIAFMLELAKQLPHYVNNNPLWTPEVAATQRHMAQMHPFLPWFLIGIFSIFIGLIRVLRTMIRFFLRRRRQAGREAS